MSRKQVVILAALGGFVALVAVFGVLSKGGSLFTAPSPSATEENGEMPGEAPGEEERAYTADVPEDATPTTPDVSAPAAPGSSASLGIFDMTVSRSGFEPSVLTVKFGNLVQIRLRATDGDYDFSMPWSGLYSVVRAGETRQISFQTTNTGTYLFECRDLCPSGKTISGQLIVLP